MSNLMELSDRYLASRAAFEEAEARAKALRTVYQEAEARMVEAMTLDDQGITSFKREDGVSLSLVRKVQFSVPAENKDALYEAVRAQGMDFLFSINPQTLNRAMREMAEESDTGELPPQFAAVVVPYEKVSLAVRGRRMPV